MDRRGDPEDELTATLNAIQSLRFVSQKEVAAALGISESAMTKRIRRIVATGRISEDGVKDALGRARKLRDADASGEIVSFDPNEEAEDPDY